MFTEAKFKMVYEKKGAVVHKCRSWLGWKAAKQRSCNLLLGESAAAISRRSESSENGNVGI